MKEKDVIPIAGKAYLVGVWKEQSRLVPAFANWPIFTRVRDEPNRYWADVVRVKC